MRSTCTRLANISFQKDGKQTGQVRYKAVCNRTYLKDVTGEGSVDWSKHGDLVTGGIEGTCEPFSLHNINILGFATSIVGAMCSLHLSSHMVLMLARLAAYRSSHVSRMIECVYKQLSLCQKLLA